MKDKLTVTDEFCYDNIPELRNCRYAISFTHAMLKEGCFFLTIAGFTLKDMNEKISDLCVMMLISEHSEHSFFGYLHHGNFQKKLTVLFMISFSFSFPFL